MKISSFISAAVLSIVGFSHAAFAAPVALSLTKLSGTTGGSPASTAAFRADLSGVGLTEILSITINDNSSQLGGAAGQFSGFDLDAIILSTTFCADATCVAGLAGLSVFDYSATGTLFTPGTQRAPAAAKLFGTDVTGTQVDNVVATLNAFDGNSTTAIPGADGFVSMGDNGVLSFNLTSATSTTGLYLYLGEVGDNGEAIAGSIEVDNTVVTRVAEPESMLLFGLGLLGVMGIRLKSKKA